MKRGGRLDLTYVQNKSYLTDVQNRGEGVQPECKSFEVVLFSPILTLFWTLNGGGEEGVNPVQKVVRHFEGRGHFWTMSKRKVLFF